MLSLHFDKEPCDQNCFIFMLCPQRRLLHWLVTHQLHRRDGSQRIRVATVPQSSSTVPTMSQRSLSSCPIIHFDCRVRTKPLETKICFTVKINYATNQLRFKTPWDTGQAVAQWVASAWLNNAQQSGFAYPYTALQWRHPIQSISIIVINSRKM